MIIAAFGVGTTLGLMMIAIDFYFTTSFICTEALIPEEMQWTPKAGPRRCKITTVGFGELTDLEVIHLYRIQQILNFYLNEIFRSAFVAFHHVACLATVVVLLVFVIRYQKVITAEGPLGNVAVISCMLSPLVMIFFQCKMAGAVVDISQDFKFEPCKKCREDCFLESLLDLVLHFILRGHVRFTRLIRKPLLGLCNRLKIIRCNCSCGKFK